MVYMYILFTHLTITFFSYLQPSPLSNEDNVVCITTHFTTFAGGWAVAPNTIDWNFVFSNADFFKNPTLYITEIVIAVAYIIAMIWARRKDKQDLEKVDNSTKTCYSDMTFLSKCRKLHYGYLLMMKMPL